MEETQVLLPKVAWPARGGKEIIYRASSPRDPNHLDGLDADIGRVGSSSETYVPDDYQLGPCMSRSLGDAEKFTPDGTGSQLPGAGGPGLQPPVTGSK